MCGTPHGDGMPGINPGGVLFFAVALFELLDTSGSVYLALGTGKERVALVADVNAHRVFVAFRFKRVAAGTCDRTSHVIRVDTFFHTSNLLTYVSVRTSVYFLNPYGCGF